MIHNTDPTLIVLEYIDDISERAHRVIAWTDAGEPLIVGLKGLETPRFRAWALDDETVLRDSTEQRVRRALAEGRVGARK